MALYLTSHWYNAGAGVVFDDPKPSFLVCKDKYVEFWMLCYYRDLRMTRLLKYMFPFKFKYIIQYLYHAI